jgi:diguanylate cyclase (GGDEF)-like protein
MELAADAEERAGRAWQAGEAGAADGGDHHALGWAALTRGYYLMRYGGPREADAVLGEARKQLRRLGDRRGELLAQVGQARCRWMRGGAEEALDEVLPLRAEALTLLKDEERGVFLNVIAGCYSSLGRSDQAFAYMYQGLRESSATRNRGFDVVLYCNLAHELYQLGDYHEALSYVEEGLKRAADLNNPRLIRVLLLNRIICLTDLGRPAEALADIREAVFLGSAVSQHDASHEALAIGALRAGELQLGRELVERARRSIPEDALADARAELVVAEAELLRAEGDRDGAIRILEEALPGIDDTVSLRIRALLHRLLADLHEESGQAGDALRSLRRWQELQLERSTQASLARHQAASLQTELLRLVRQRDESEARRRATERARKELEAANRALAEANEALARKVAEVEALQAELRQQAIRDVLTGLFNRRYLNDILPTLVAQARREDEPLSVVILDLDHFKELNDARGHLEGDRVLAAFGRLLDRRLRKGDVACRYGGEEFCLLLPRTDAPGARRKVARLLEEWRAAGPTTFSAGIADTRAVEGSEVAILQKADDAALEAKRQGRARIVIAEGAGGPGSS